MKIFRTIVAILALALVPAGTLATTADPATRANPSLSGLIGGIDRGEGGPEPVLSELSINIDQHGTIAEFTLDARITNPTDDEIEANFTMQLPRDAVVTGYALDIDGVMITGSLIDQPKARQVYEDEVRGNIDPGLAEVSSTNEFSTRIYPIRPEGSRRITLKFVTPIDVADGLSLPLSTAGPIDLLRFTASASGVEAPPVITLGEDEPFTFTRDGREWTVDEVTKGNKRLSGDLRIASVAPRSRAMASEHSSGRTFFTITDSAVAASLADNPPDRVRVYWDTSRSRADALHESERDLLGRFLDIIGPETLDVVQFSSATPTIASFTGNDSAELEAHLTASTYRGATSFAGLETLDLTDADLCILFSDGGVSLDHSVEFRPDCPLLIVSSGPAVDGARLGQIASDAGAMQLSLTKDNTYQVLEQMQRMPISVVDLRDAGGNRLDYRMIPAGKGRFTVIGELGDWDEVRLRLSGTRAGDRRKTYIVNASRAERHDGAGVLWAAQEVTRLSRDPSDREKMQRLSQDFQVASPTMAFLVLERPDQYVNAEIEPPQGFGEEWMKDYLAQKERRDRDQQDAREERLEFAIREWDEAKDWWASKFDTDGVIRDGRARTGAVRAPEEAAEAAEDAAAPPPPPPPPPAPAPVANEAPRTEFGLFEAEEADGQFIVVTGARRVNDSVQEVPVAVTVVTGEDAAGAQVQVELADVLTNQPYIEALREADADRLPTVLAEQEALYGSVPGFYLDVAEFFRLQGETELARQLLLSALDLPTADDETRLIVAFRLERDGDFDTAVALLERLASAIDYRTQPKRTLALAIASQAMTKTGREKREGLERAFTLLREVVLEPTDGRYDGIEVVSLMELNSLIPLIEAAGGEWEIDERLVAQLDTDIRIVAEWTSADADIDLWVNEPSGEDAYYGNQLTQLGGKMSNDMTNGYGPEEYVIRRAAEGQYEVRIKGFSGDRINPNGPGRVMVRLIRNFARPNQSSELIDAEVSFDRSESDNDRAVATITVE